MKNGGEKALDNPYIKGTIDTMLQQKKAEAAVISDETGKSEIERKYSTNQLKGMSSEELEKLLPHA
jgi:polynucleotide 5'-kinase involved in rRNA processing